MSVITPIVDTLVRKETPEAKAVSGFFGGVKNKLLEEPGRALAADQAAAANKQKEIKANYKKPGYDQTPLEKTRRAAARAGWDPITSKEPISPVISRENRLNDNSPSTSPGTFNGKQVNVGSDGKLTLDGREVGTGLPRTAPQAQPAFTGYSKTTSGQIPYGWTSPDGSKSHSLPAREDFVPMFSTPTQPAPQQGGNPFFIKSTAAQGLVPQPGTASAIPGMQQNPAVGMPGGNVTKMMDMETAALSAAMKSGGGPVGNGAPQGGVPGLPQIPGGAPQQGDRAYRDLEGYITDLTNRQKAFMNGTFDRGSFGDLQPTQRMTYAAQLGDQIKGAQDTLFNRSSLSNDVVKALLAAQTSEKNTDATNITNTKNQIIESSAGLQGKQIDAGATNAAAATKALMQESRANDKLSLDALKAMRTPLEQGFKDNTLTPEQKKEYDTITAQMAKYVVVDDDDVDENAPSYGR